MLLPLIMWIVILVIVVPIFGIFTIPLLIFRFGVNLIAAVFRRDLIGRLSSRDLVFTSDTFYGKARKNVISCSITSGSMDVRQLRAKFRERVLDKDEFFKLKCRPVLFLKYWFWQQAGENPEQEVIEEVPMMTDQEVKDFLPQWVSSGYKKGQPLWSIKMAPMPGNRTAVIIKLHHMVADGVSFMMLLEAFCDPGWKRLEVPPAKSMRFTHLIYAWYSFPWKALKAYWLARTRKGFRPKAFYGDAFTSWTELSMEKIKVVRRHTKTMFHTVLAGLMSSSFNKLLDSSGKLEKPDFVRIVIPTPWPNRPSKLCNHVAWLHADLAIGEDNAMHRFEECVKQSYISGMHGVMWDFFRGLYLLPAPLLAVYTNWGETNLPPVVLSSIPGSLTKVTMVGNEVNECIPVLALGCSTGVNACVTTYGDFACFSLRVSKEVLPSQEMVDALLTKYMQDELDNLYLKALNDVKMSETSNNNDHVKIVISEETHQADIKHTPS